MLENPEKSPESIFQHQSSQSYATLQILIDQVIKTSLNPDSESGFNNNNNIAISAFQQYVSSKFRQLYVINEAKSFLNDIFVSISLHSLHNNSKLYLIFASALINTDIGDKYFKANRIAKDLNNLVPFEAQDTKSWEILEKILLWLKKNLGTSMNATVSMLRDKMLQWFIPSDLSSYLSSLHILNILLRDFPVWINNILDDAEKIILDSIQSNEKIIRDLGCRTLESALSINDMPFHFMCISISHLLFSETNLPSEGLINAVYSVIKSAPQIRTLFTFAEPPIQRLAKDQSSVNFKLLVLSYRCTPSLFTEKEMNRILSLFLSFISKKQIRKIALTSLGEIGFLSGDHLHQNHEESVKKLTAAIWPRNLNCDEAGFALLSLISPNDEQFVEQFMSILVLPLSQLLLEGIRKFFTNYKNTSFASLIRKWLIPLFTPILCNLEDNDKKHTLAAHALETMIFLQYEKNDITLSLLVHYSYLLTVDDVNLNEKMTELLLYFQDTFPVLRFRLLSFISYSSFDELRLSVLQKISYSHDLCSVIKSFLNDRSPKLARETMRILCENNEKEEIRLFLNSSITRFPLYDSTRYRHLIKMYLLIANRFLDLFEPICDIAFENFFQIEFHFPASLELLSLLLKLPNGQRNCDERIIIILENHLKLHSTIVILQASLDLLLSVIEHTNIKLSSQLINQLYEVSRYAEDSELQVKLFHTISYLTNLIQEDYKERDSDSDSLGSRDEFGAFPLIYSLGSRDPFTSLVYASVAVSLNLLFDIVGDDSLVSLHSSALEALIRILKNFRHIGDELSEILVEKMNSFITNSILSTVSLFLNNFSLFAMVFGNKMKSVIPHVIDIICKNWGTLDISLLLRITEWIIMTYKTAFKPYIFKIANLFISDLFARPPEQVNLILSTFVSFGPMIKEVHSIVLPAFLDWINNTNASISMTIINDTLLKLKSILIELDDKTYGLAVLRTLSSILQRLPKSEDDMRIMDVFCLIVVQMKSDFILFYPEFAKIIEQHQTEDLNEVIQCIVQKKPIPKKITALYKPNYFEKPMQPSKRSFSITFDTSNYKPPQFSLSPKSQIENNDILNNENNEDNNENDQNEMAEYDEEEEEEEAIVEDTEFESYNNRFKQKEPQQQPKNSNKTKNTKKSRKNSRTTTTNNNNNANVNKNNLNDFEISQTSWEQWIDETASLFIQNSPSVAISASSAISDKHNHMKMSLFPISLALSVAMSQNNPIWSKFFNLIFTSRNVPSSIVRLFLSTIEFLEVVHIDPLPVSYEVLAQAALNAGQVILSLRYTEINFLNNPRKFSEELVKLNQRLGMKMSANGVFRYIKKEASILSQKRKNRRQIPLQFTQEKETTTTTANKSDIYEQQQIRQNLQKQQEQKLKQQRLQLLHSNNRRMRLNKSVSLFSQSANSIDSFASYSSSFQGEELIQLLGYWEDALVELDSKLVSTPEDQSLLENKMYCLHQLSHFNELQKISETNNSPIFAAIAAWNKLEIDKFKSEFSKISENIMDSYTNLKNNNTPLNYIITYYEIIYYVVIKNYEKATLLINLTRRSLSSNLFPLLFEDQKRSMPLIWDGTLLCEIEEIITILRNKELEELNGLPSFIPTPFIQEEQKIQEETVNIVDPLKRIWENRLISLSANNAQNTLYKLILLRSLVLNKEEMKDLWSYFIGVTHSAGLTEMSQLALNEIGEKDFGKFLEIKSIYKKNHEQGIALLDDYIQDHKNQISLNIINSSITKISFCTKTLCKWLIRSERFPEAEKLLKEEFFDNNPEKNMVSGSINDWKIYFLFSKCCESPNWSFNALLQCVKMNPRLALKFTPKIFSILFSGSNEASFIETTKQQQQQKRQQKRKSNKNNFAFDYDIEEEEEEEQEFIDNIIILDNQNNNQNAIETKKLIELFRSNYMKTSPSVWLFHLPQIISMLGTEFNDLMNELLLYISTDYLQDVAHSVISSLRNGKKQCEDIINKLTIEHPNVINEVTMFSGELIRIASCWYEIFNNWLDEASRNYIEPNERDKFEKILNDIQHFFSQEPATLIDLQFASDYGPLLSKAENLYNYYLKTKEEVYIHQIWSAYVEMFQKVRSKIDSITQFNVKDVSPWLATKLQDSVLTVPFCSDDVRIKLFSEKITIIPSKQRPRKIGIVGSNGNTYTFLLKANEDTRLDERIMQFFTLYNSLVDSQNHKKKMKNKNSFDSYDSNSLVINTYGIRPLSNNVGLIGWVSGCKTLFDVLKENRQRWGVDVNAEMHKTLNICPNYERLPSEKKFPAFVAGLQATKGDDIKEILYANAIDSSQWHLRRKTYTDSIASTSMVGYIIGLGDRHFGNIMMKTNSAKLVHIDFGDSFEVTMYRKTFPETVPFRLTRIMVNALEACGVEGSFRELCAEVMDTLRNNREMILGVLETFVYDPVLVDREKSNPKQILRRIADKLGGIDFGVVYPMPIEKQVDILIKEAQDLNNLCKMFSGWRPWW